MMSDKEYLKEEIDELIGNIKALTKLIVAKYDPLEIYNDELMAVCSLNVVRLGNYVLVFKQMMNAIIKY